MSTLLGLRGFGAVPATAIDRRQSCHTIDLPAPQRASPSATHAGRCGPISRGPLHWNHRREGEAGSGPARDAWTGAWRIADRRATAAGRPRGVRSNGGVPDHRSGLHTAVPYTLSLDVFNRTSAASPGKRRRLPERSGGVVQTAPTQQSRDTPPQQERKSSSAPSRAFTSASLRR